ncbi:MAG: hypothetical protein HRU70_07010 [Phycisphaeraceae bacterium]|nr:MAG: hypothetical protein HRU70_07010 [Phycisphaeraceae bacterium]
MSGAPPRRAIVARVARDSLVLLLAGVWVWSGVGKWIDLDAFRETVRAHGVLGDWVGPFVWLIPSAEIMLGVAVIVLATRARPAVITLSASALVVIGLTAYVALVPSEVIAQAGCGCRGAIPSITNEPVAVYAQNAALLIIHAIAAGAMRYAGRAG